MTVYAIPRDSVIGSTVALDFVPDDGGGSVVRQLAPNYLDDGPVKRVQIWNRAGRRPVLAAGTPTATPRCLISPSTRTSRPCAFSRHSPWESHGPAMERGADSSIGRLGGFPRVPSRQAMSQVI